MNKLFDLRFVIGVFFSLIGLMLFVYGLLKGIGINTYCGILFMCFGLVMLAVSRNKR